MPLLFSLGQHSALVAIQEDLYDNDALLDDIYTLPPHPTEWEMCTNLWMSICGRTPESASTEERRRCGMQSTTDQSSVMYWSRSLKGRTPMPGCGAVLRSFSTNKASKSWGHLWAIHSLWRRICARKLQLRRCCWNAFLRSLTYNPHGPSCFIALPPEQNIC